MKFNRVNTGPADNHIQKVTATSRKLAVPAAENRSKKKKKKRQLGPVASHVSLVVKA
jgi:hypothetical protein